MAHAQVMVFNKKLQPESRRHASHGSQRVDVIARIPS